MPNLATVGQKIAHDKQEAAAKKRYQKENTARGSEFAEILVTRYGATREGQETALTDLLADVRHFCDTTGLNFSHVDRRAHEHYTAEVVQARTGVEQ